MQLAFRAIDEPTPGPRWRAQFEKNWPAYQRWYLSERTRPPPTYLASKKALEAAMPELMPIYERLVELAGGGDMAARFLSLYCPAPYISGCSQLALNTADGPALIRNYDYSTLLCEGTL